jgi:hemerythrin
MIKWTNDYAVGITLIDQQHQKFVATFNKLYDAFLAGEAENKLEEVLDELVDYAEVHFSTEEKYFKEFNCPEMAEHIMEHDLFRNQIVEFQKCLGGTFDRKQLSDELVELLDDWLAKHVVEMVGNM